LAERPLASFVLDRESRAAASFRSSLIPSVVSFVDTLDGQPVTTYDTVWTNPSTASQIEVRTSTLAGLAWEADLYYPDAGSTSDPMLSTSAAIVTGMPGDEDIIEETFTGGDWWQAEYDVQNMPGYPGGGSVRAGLPSFGPAWGGEKHPVGSLEAPGDSIEICASVALTKENCNTFRYARAGFVGAALVAATAGVVAAVVPGGQGASWWFLKATGTLILSAVASHVAYKTCLAGP